MSPRTLSLLLVVHASSLAILLLTAAVWAFYALLTLLVAVGRLDAAPTLGISLLATIAYLVTGLLSVQGLAQVRDARAHGGLPESRGEVVARAIAVPFLGALGGFAALVGGGLVPGAHLLVFSILLVVAVYAVVSDPR